MFRRDTSKIKKHFIHSKDHYKDNKFYKKSWCKYCMSASVQQILDEEINAVNSGFRDVVRSEDEIEADSKYSTSSLHCSH